MLNMSGNLWLIFAFVFIVFVTITIIAGLYLKYLPGYTCFQETKQLSFQEIYAEYTNAAITVLHFPS